jgi:rSAM/selenodomain-associated transferase 1
MGAPSRVAPFRRRLVIMAKAPFAGAAKRRLAAEIGSTEATRFARAAAAALLGRLGRDARWQTILAVSPDRFAKSRIWPPKLETCAQGPGDLGQRMQRLLQARPPGPLIIIGTDIPGICASHIALAFRLLGSRDAVFGPAIDGGYWLVGLRRRPRLLQPFQQVRWSGPHALKDTLGNLSGHMIGFVPTLADIDSAKDYRRNADHLGRHLLPANLRRSAG